MYNGKSKVTYRDLEECVLACFILKPELMETTKLEEKHFRKFGRMYVFFKCFYDEHKCLDINLIYSVLKDTEINDFVQFVVYLMDFFVMPSRFQDYENMLISFYQKDKKDEFLRKKIYEKATKLYLGTISLNEFNKEVDSLYKNVKKIEWK